MKQKRIILLIIAIFIIFSPTTISIIKGMGDKDVINLVKEVSYESNSSVIKYKDGILIYDGKSLSYIDCNAQKQFSFNVVLNNYEIATNDQNICMLDKNTNELYIINSSGKLISRVTLKEKVSFIKMLKNGSIVIQYDTDVDVEGVKIIDASGKEINNVSIPKISINFISEDGTGGFLLSGIMQINNKLVNNIFYYNSKGELVFSDNVEDKLFIDAMFVGDYIYFIDPTYCEIRDKNFEIVSKTTFEEPIKSIKQCKENIVVIDKNGKIIAVNPNGKQKVIENELQPVKGIDFIDKQLVVYSDRSIYLKSDKKRMDFTNDIENAISVNDKYLILVFRNNIKFYKFN